MSNSQKKTEFGTRLQITREKCGFSRAQLAKKLGLSNPSQISRYESGKGFPGIAALGKLSKELNVDLHWLITGSLSPIVTNILDSIRPYTIAHLSEVTTKLQKLERERRDLYARDGQGENLKGAIKDVEALIEKQHRYYEKAFHVIDDALEISSDKHKDALEKAAQLIK